MTLAREFSKFSIFQVYEIYLIFEFSFLNHNEVDTTDLTTSRTGLGDIEIQFDLVVVVLASHRQFKAYWYLNSHVGFNLSSSCVGFWTILSKIPISSIKQKKSRS